VQGFGTSLRRKRGSDGAIGMADRQGLSLLDQRSQDLLFITASARFRHDGQKFQRRVREIFPGMPLNRGPVNVPGSPANVISAAVGMSVAQVYVRQPDHQSRARNVVHRRLLVWRHSDANDDDGFVLKFDHGIGRSGLRRRGAVGRR
jgi:hypothetical protein